MQVFYCAWCDARIDDEIIARRHYSASRMPTVTTCCREHEVLYRQQVGTYKRMSEAGADGRRAFLKAARPHRKRKGESNESNAI